MRNFSYSLTANSSGSEVLVLAIPGYTYPGPTRAVWHIGPSGLVARINTERESSYSALINLQIQ